MPHKSVLGNRGERDATTYLSHKGYQIIDRNYYVRGGEIDIVCQKGDCLVFVEVKARAENSLGKPYEAINYHKLTKLKMAIVSYLKTHEVIFKKMRIDVIGIEYSTDGNLKKIKHYENVSVDDVR